MKQNAPTRPTLRQIQYFVAVAEYGAFGTAAEALSVSQPSLSKQLATMEAELGADLFERTSRSVKLTSTGEKLLPYGRTILNEVREFRALARGADGVFGNRLSIGVLPSIGAYFMPLASRKLHRMYPNLRLFMQEGSTDPLMAMLKDGRFDVVIGTPTNDPEFVSHFLFSESLWACAAADDPFSESKGPITCADLTGKPLLSLGPGFRLTEIVQHLAELSGAYVNRDYQGASLDAVRQMAVMGAGIAVLPSLYALAEAIRDPEFVVRRIDEPEAQHDIGLLWRRSSPMEADCLELAKHLISVKKEIRAARSKRFR